MDPNKHQYLCSEETHALNDGAMKVNDLGPRLNEKSHENIKVKTRTHYYCEKTFIRVGKACSRKGKVYFMK